MGIGWAIISTGRHADTKLAPAINAACNTRLVAVYSRDKKQAETFAEKHNADMAFDSFSDLLSHSEIDVIHIASPNHLHAPYAITAARAGKHVLVEKPMALSVPEGLEMLAACQSNGTQLGVGFHLRHHPGHLQAREWIEQNVLGDVALVQVQWAYGIRGQIFPPIRTGRHEWWDHPEMAGAGALMATGVHCLDMLRSILGQEVIQVTALTDGQSQSRPIDSLCTILLRFDGGTLAMVSCGRKLPDSQNNAIFYGNQGSLQLLGTMSTALEGSMDLKTETKNVLLEYELQQITMYTKQVEDFNHILEGEQHNVASGWDGLQVIQTTQAILQSARTGQTILTERLRL